MHMKCLKRDDLSTGYIVFLYLFTRIPLSLALCIYIQMIFLPPELIQAKIKRIDNAHDYSEEC